ncbi:MAG: polysaccharide biosynthesis/export family protein [Candidatus Acidiferrum sp.]
MRFLILFLMAVSLAAGNPRQQAGDQDKAKENTSKGAPAQTPVEHAAANSQEYKIGPQDVLKVDVWKEDQLTRTVPVRPDGKITLPLINDVQAAGLTPMELAGVIREGLRKFINEPQVTVTVSEINSRRIFVTGEVMRPGAFVLFPHMTVLQALSTCGGFTQFAKEKNVYVLRTSSGKQEKLPFNYKDAVSGKSPGQNIELQPGDVVVVP